MKYMKLYASALFVGLALGFTACDDDEDYSTHVNGDPTNRVFTNVVNSGGQAGAIDLANSVGFSFTHTPVSSTLDAGESFSFSLPISCTKPATSDITVNVAIDASKLPAGYTAFPVTPTMSAQTSTIKSGETEGTPVTFTVSESDYSKFSQANAPYCLPIVISSSNGTVSENLNTAYIVVRASFTNVKDDNTTSCEGTALDRTDWVITLDGSSTDAYGSDVTESLTDGSNWSYIEMENLPQSIIADLGSTQSVQSVSINWYRWYYAAENMTLSTSTDGVNYTEQGTISVGYNSIGCVNLYGAVDCRYVKITCKGYNYYADAVACELNVYTK